MAYINRKDIYTKIQEIRKRPLITYITSLKSNVNVQMAPDSISEISKQILKIDDKYKEVDILIISNGGDPITSWRIISMLRERFDKVGVLLPYVAYSAATLLALGADEIIMHPFANLGPVDPQLVYRKNGNNGNTIEEIRYGSEDIRNFLEFVKNDVGITDQEQKHRAFELLCKEVGSIPIGVAKRSSQLSVSMGEKLLSTHMKDSNKAKTISEALNSSFYHHGYALNRTEVGKIGLPVITPKKELETLLWNVWCDIENDMECSKPFDPLEIIMASPEGNQLLNQIPTVNIPANLPIQLQQQVLNDILQQINVTNISPIEYELFLAVVESIEFRSEFRLKGKLTAFRTPDMNIAINNIKISSGWTFLENCI